MGSSLKATFDASGWDKVFNALDGPLKESLARRMGVSGGRIIRDEAKLRAPSSDGATYNPTSRGSHAAGTLKNAIKVIYNERLSSTTQYVYSVTWINRDAWWGKLIEFGHWQTQYLQRPDGMFYTPKHARDKVRWVPAEPFLAPAYEARILDAKAAMIERGKNELPILLREHNKG